LRARHARMWGALLVVVPAVLGAALSVRRDEAARQELPRALLDETAAISSESSEAGVEVAWWRWIPFDWSAARWVVEPTAGTWLLEVTAPPGGVVGERLLYLSDGGLPGLEDLMLDDSNFDPDLPAWLPLPHDARLIGAWPDGATRRFAAPAGVAWGQGLLLQYDLATNTVVGAAICPQAPEPAR
jgi:hypothetical protein